MARKPKLTLEQQREVCTRYLAQERCEDLGHELSVHPVTILNVLKAHGIDRTVNFRNLTPKEVEEVYLRSLQGETSYQLAKAFGVSRPAISKHLRNAGIVRQKIAGERRRYHCDDNFFSEIDTPEKAYILGFIATDGNVKNDHVLRIGLKVTDAAHLETIARFFGNAPVKISNERRSPVCEWAIYSAQIVKDLARYGIVPNKTFTVSWPELRPDLYRHFVRGAFDGDGCFHVIKDGRMSLNFVGNAHLSPAVLRFVTGECAITPVKLQMILSKRTARLSCVRWMYSGNARCLPIVNFLYEDATIFLPRKRQLVLDHYRALPKYRDQLRFG